MNHSSTYISTLKTSVKTLIFKGEKCLFGCRFFPSFSDCDSTGKELDAETGYGYFGARYYDATLLTSWTAVDPMSDKYPSLSPYNYCAGNPVKLIDPDGNDWYKAGDGSINYTTNNNSSMGKYLGKTTKDGSTYYSLFGQQIDMKNDKSRRNAEITMKIDQQMISYAKYLEADNNYKWSIYNQEGPSQPYTDFKIPPVVFDRSWGTTSQNQHGPSEMGTYAGMADIYYYVNGGGKEGSSMKAQFDCWEGTTCITGRNGNFTTPTSQGESGNLQRPYLTFKNGNNVIVALNFHSDRQKELFKNKFYALFPESKPRAR